MNSNYDPSQHIFIAISGLSGKLALSSTAQKLINDESLAQLPALEYLSHPKLLAAFKELGSEATANNRCRTIFYMIDKALLNCYEIRYDGSEFLFYNHDIYLKIRPQLGPDFKVTFQILSLEDFRAAYQI